MKKIKDLPLSLQPIEKLYQKGPANLTEAELLAILIGTGNDKQNALSLAKNLLKYYPINALSQLTRTQLHPLKGIGPTKSARVMAAIELGFRIYHLPQAHKVIINSTQSSLQHLQEIADKKQEHIVVLYLNARHELIKKEVAGIGNLNAALIEPKEIFAPALTTPCAAIILAHNHPSGDPHPSAEDIEFTLKIQQAGDLLGVKLIDHLILSEKDYFSFWEENWSKMETK